MPYTSDLPRRIATYTEKLELDTDDFLVIGDTDTGIIKKIDISNVIVPLADNLNRNTSIT